MPQISSRNSQASPSTRNTRSSPSEGSHGTTVRSTAPPASQGRTARASAKASAATPIASQVTACRRRSRHASTPPANGRQSRTSGTTSWGIRPPWQEKAARGTSRHPWRRRWQRQDAHPLESTSRCEASAKWCAGVRLASIVRAAYSRTHRRRSARMTAALSSAPPRRILLATDLRSRSDRAVDRAVQLAAQWQAALHVVHAPAQVDDAWPAAPLATDGERASSTELLAERRLRRDLGDTVAVHVVEGEPATAILAVAAEQDCELIVLGARDVPPAGRLGRVAEALLRRSPASLLVVKERAR